MFFNCSQSVYPSACEEMIHEAQTMSSDSFRLEISRVFVHLMWNFLII